MRANTNGKVTAWELVGQWMVFPVCCPVRQDLEPCPDGGCSCVISNAATSSVLRGEESSQMVQQMVPLSTIV